MLRATGFTMGSVLAVRPEQKEQALREILESAAFRRAEILKSVLEFLCAQEAAGRAHAVTEYEIGVHALGRPADFSTETDSSVRTRIHALRRKLEDYYADEGAFSDIHLELPKGTYGIRYVAPSAPVTEPLPSPDEVPPLVAVAPPAPNRWPLLALGALAGALLVGIGVWLGPSLRPESEQERLIRQAWGPMLRSVSPVAIAVATPLQLYVRDFGDAPEPIGDPAFRLPAPRTEDFLKWYRQWADRPLGSTAILHPNHHSPLWGDAAAAASVARFLAFRGVASEVVPAYRVHPVAFRDKNLVLIGRSEYSPSVGKLMPEDGLTLTYSAEHRRVGVQNSRQAPSSEPLWWFAADSLKRNYGLITVGPVDTGGRHRMLIFSGINSDGADAGVTFYSSPEGLAEIDRHFRDAGLRQWPDRFQVVVRTESVDSYSLRTQFEHLRVLK